MINIARTINKKKQIIKWNRYLKIAPTICDDVVNKSRMNNHFYISIYIKRIDLHSFWRRK